MTKEAERAVEAPPPTARVDPDTEHLAEQMSRLLAELARTPEAELAAGWAPGLEAGERLGRFTLLRELGRGGMGVVWEAEDRELRRSVALKVVRPGSRIAARGEEWLRREAEAVARLNHPNIVTLFDFGTAHSGPYLVFELLRGQPLDRRAGRLPLRAALHVGAEVARALVHAHKAGVLHRDLKPANVFVADDGAVKVLDFGLAHLLGRAGPGQGGTPTSMAPEQWRGEPGDERTDLFALGVLLHAALTGEVPYPVKDGRSAVERPGPTPALPPGAAPRRLRRLVSACLERDPARRPSSAQAVLDELRALERSIEGRWRRRLVSALAAVAATAALGAGWLWWTREPPAGERLPVVVADVENRTGDAALDGLSGLLTAALEPSRRVDLVPRARLLSLAHQAGMGELVRLDARAARELSRVAGAKVLLTTAARREGSGVLVEVRGTDPTDDRPLFTVAESGAAGEVAAVLDGLAEKVRRKLRERREDLAAGRISLADAVTASPEAARLYYQGLDCEVRPAALGKTAAMDCADLYREALAHDPAFPMAHYRLAWMAVMTGEPSEEDRAHLTAALRAVDRLTPADALRVHALSDQASGRLDDALHKLEALLARQPDDRGALLDAAYIHQQRGAWAAAIPYYERLLATEPETDLALDGLVRCLGSLGRRVELRAHLDHARQQPPTPDRTEAIVRGLVWIGEAEEAAGVARAAVVGGGGAPAESLLLQTLLVSGRLTEAEAMQRRRVAQVPTRVPSRWSLALNLAGQGRMREALATLDEAEAIGAAFPPEDFRRMRAVVIAGAGRAEPVWREAARIATLRPDVSGELAVLLALLGDVPHAERAAAAAPGGRAEAEQVAALLAWRRGDATDALARLAAAEQRDPWPTGGLFPAYLTAEVASAAGEHREVLAAAQRFARLWPRGYWYGWASARLLLLTARAHQALGEVAAARADADRLLARLGAADRDLPLLGEARALRSRL